MSIERGHYKTEPTDATRAPSPSSMEMVRQIRKEGLVDELNEDGTIKTDEDGKPCRYITFTLSDSAAAALIDQVKVLPMKMLHAIEDMAVKTYRYQLTGRRAGPANGYPPGMQHEQFEIIALANGYTVEKE